MAADLGNVLAALKVLRGVDLSGYRPATLQRRVAASIQIRYPQCPSESGKVAACNMDLAPVVAEAMGPDSEMLYIPIMSRSFHTVDTHLGKGEN